MYALSNDPFWPSEMMLRHTTLSMMPYKDHRVKSGGHKAFA